MKNDITHYNTHFYFLRGGEIKAEYMMDCSLYFDVENEIIKKNKDGDYGSEKDEIVEELLK